MPALEDEQLPSEYGINIQLLRAICIPDACSTDDLELWLSNYTKKALKFNDDYCQSVSTKPILQWDSILTLCVLGMIALVIFASSVLDILKHDNHAIIKAFSIPENVKKLFKPSNDINKMKFVDGLKTMSMVWIIYCHGYLLLIDEPLTNYAYILEVVEKVPVMVIISGTLAVDSFLLVSGFLLAYTTAKAKKINISIAIFHRYLRLTPVLAVVVMIHSTLIPFFGSGPIYPKHKQLFMDNCQRYWWSALLYIQNFVNSRYMCVPQSWYLSVDMQLYVVSLFLMVLLKKKLKIGIGFIIFLIFVSIITSFVISWVYELPGSIAGFTENRNNDDFMPLYYFQSYTRMAPYLMGVLLGYLLYYIKQNNVILKIRIEVILCVWCATLAILITCVFAGHQTIILDTHDKISNSLYLTFLRPAWSLAVSWVIFACALNYGGLINEILSLHVFEILSRLSYGMYLVHYAIIQLRYLSTRSPIELDIIDQGLRFWGFFAASVFFAAIFSLLFESPVVGLEKIIFKPKTRRKTEEENGKV